MITLGRSCNGESMADQKFTKSDRLRKRDEFARVYQSKIYAADNVLVITAMRNQLEVSRLGLSVSKRVGNAVTRNRWKRLIREAFRVQKSSLPQGLDFVVRPRKGAKCEYQMIQESLGKLLQRVNKKLV